MSENWPSLRALPVVSEKKGAERGEESLCEERAGGNSKAMWKALNWGMAAGGAWLDMHVLLQQPKNVQERGGLPLLYPRVDWTGGLWVWVVGGCRCLQKENGRLQELSCFCQVSNSSQWLLTPNAVLVYWRAWNMFPGPNGPAVFSRCALFQPARAFLENCGEFTFL